MRNVISNFESSEKRLEVWELLRGTAEGRNSARNSLIEELDATPHLPSALTDLAVHHAGDPAARALCAEHLRDPHWADWLPLSLQEYSALFPSDTRFHENIQTAMRESGWASSHLQALQSPGESGFRAARSLLSELHLIANEAAQLLERLKAMRARITPSLHALQVQALMRAELALGNLRGRKVLEVGPQRGGLLLELLQTGVDVLGVDIGPQIEHPSVLQGDFLEVDLPRHFELIIATAVFEFASCTDGDQNSDARNQSREVLHRFRELTVPGAAVVLENIMFPIPFSRQEAEAAGFKVLRIGMPSVNLPMGGRGCVLQRTSG
ncbi:MAG: hypothetical protein ABW123_12395 [Cystobacter sp.]